MRDRTFREIDALVLPTVPTVYTVEQVLADPIQLNSRLGTYTNFVNLLELCGLAIPASMRPDGTPFGVTLLARSGHDAMLASIGRVFHADTGLPMGATGEPQPPLPACDGQSADSEIAIAVVGAHLSGMPLNGELTSLGARRLETTQTAPDYRLLALAGTEPAKPGLLRVASGGGAAIELEIWALPAAQFGRFVAAVPPPLSHRHGRAGGWAQREGLSGRSAGDRRRARHLGIRRLARLHGAAETPRGVAQGSLRLNWNSLRSSSRRRGPRIASTESVALGARFPRERAGIELRRLERR